MTSVFENEYPVLFRYIRERKLEIHYCASRRAFAIGGIDSCMRQEIHFCPWSGKRLPKSLAAEFSRMLETKDLSGLEPETWPEAWRSEKWWIDAGL